MSNLVSNKERPVLLNLAGFAFPITAIASILHRVTGVLLVVAIGLCLVLAQFAAQSEASFDQVTSYLMHPFGKFIIAGLYAVLMYHALAGVRHIIQDFGYWHSLQAARTSAFVVIGLAVIEWLLALLFLFLS